MRSRTGTSWVRSISKLALIEFAIVLGTGHTKPRNTRSIDRPLPGDKFFDGQIVSSTGFIDRKQPTIYCSDYLGLATHHPPLGARQRKVFKCQRLTQRADNRCWPKCCYVFQIIPRSCCDVLTSRGCAKLTQDG